MNVQRGLIREFMPYELELGYNADWFDIMAHQQLSVI